MVDLKDFSHRVEQTLLASREALTRLMDERDALKAELETARRVVEAVSSSLFSSEDHKDWRRLQDALAAYRRAVGGDRRP